MHLKMKKVPLFEDLPTPEYMTKGAAGMDLYAAIDSCITVKPLERILVSTGICIELPGGYEAQIRPRSGLALKHGITLLNSPGTIDWDYRGEIKVIIVNLGSEDFVINRGDRIAQMVINKVEQLEIHVVNSVSTTERHAGGFGSTGI